MSRLRIFVAVPFLLIGGPSHGQETAVADLVRKLDRSRLPEKSFVVDVRIDQSDPRGRKKPRTHGIKLYARKASGGPAAGFSTLSACLSPPADRNKLFLIDGKRCWFYDPRASRPTLIPSKQVWDQAFVADSLAVSYARQYEARLLGREKIRTPEGGEKLCQVVHLTARSGTKTGVNATRFWLDAEGLPVRSVLYAKSGAVLRTATYAAFRNVLGAMRPTRVTVKSPESATVIRFSNHQYRDLPDSLFKPANMPKMKIK